MSGQTQHSPVKTSNLPDKCPMSGANLQACSGTQPPLCEVAVKGARSRKIKQFQH